MMMDESRSTSNIRTVSGTQRTFKDVRKCGFHELNECFNNVERTSKSYALHIDFSKGGCGCRRAGLFTETWVAVLLEGISYDSIDSIESFIDVMVNPYCRLDNTPIIIS